MILPPVEDLPEGWTLLGAASVLKCWNARGEVRFVTRYSESLNEAEKRGMFDIGLDRLVEDDVEQHFTGDEDDDGDD